MELFSFAPFFLPRKKPNEEQDNQKAEAQDPPPRSPSEVEFGSNAVRCQSSRINSPHGNKLRTLDKGDCSAPSNTGFFLVFEANQHSVRQSPTLIAPTYLCSFRASIYLSLRQHNLCSSSDCLQLIPNQPNVDRCPLHLGPTQTAQNTGSFSALGGASILRDSAKPSAEFPNFDPHHMVKEALYEGLAQMSPLLVKQAIREAWDMGLEAELDEPKHITLPYGCVLLGNSALVEKRRPVIGPKRIPEQQQPPSIPDLLNPPTPAHLLFARPLTHHMSTSMSNVPGNIPNSFSPSPAHPLAMPPCPRHIPFYRGSA